jgi:hypothetical protein
MTEDEDVIVVFTARSPERIVREGGSQAWVLNAARAKQCSWLVCTQNRHNPNHEFSDATEPHGTAFLIGKVSGIRKSTEDKHIGKERWMIGISAFARVNIPDAWDHGRNPVRYTSLAQLKIDPAQLEFQPLPQEPGKIPTSTPPATSSSTSTLTIAEAKKALAATFGVDPDAVEITIRG